MFAHSPSHPTPMPSAIASVSAMTAAPAASPEKFITLSTQELTNEQLHTVYEWIDSLPLSKAKKNIARDFADACLLAEVLHTQLGNRAVELHNYSPSSSVQQRLYNWRTLNSKVLRRALNLTLSPTEIESVVSCQRLAIERVLLAVHDRLLVVAALEQEQRRKSLQHEAKDEERQQQQQHQQQHQNDSKSDSKQQQQSNAQLEDAVQLLQLKVQKLEQLLQLKNEKIAQLQHKLQQNGLSLT